MNAGEKLDMNGASPTPGEAMLNVKVTRLQDDMREMKDELKGQTGLLVNLVRIQEKQAGDAVRLTNIENDYYAHRREYERERGGMKGGLKIAIYFIAILQLIGVGLIGWNHDRVSTLESFHMLPRIGASP